MCREEDVCERVLLFAVLKPLGVFSVLVSPLSSVASGTGNISDLYYFEPKCVGNFVSLSW